MDEDLTPQLRQLVETLLTRTRAGSIDWRPTDQTDTYAYGAESGGILLGSYHGDGDWPLSLRVLDGRGVQVQEAVVGHGKSCAGPLFELYQAARMADRTASEVVEQLLSELGGPVLAGASSR